MANPKHILNCLNNELNEYKKSVTALSKTDSGNLYITDDTLMFDWDSIAESYGFDKSSSVDAIYCSFENGELTLYFFEFKKHDLYDKYFDAKKQLEDYINDLEKCIFCFGYSQKVKKIKKKLVSKQIISLKTKPIESLILLYDILNKLGIKPEEIINIRKEYYILSKTPIKGNLANFHRKGRSKEIFGFIDKIKPFPFAEVQPINEITFLSLINNLKNKRLC